MFFFSFLFACSSTENPPQQDTAEYMCEAICTELDMYTFTTELDSYVLDISFTSPYYERDDSINAVYNGTETYEYSIETGVNVTLTSQGFTMDTSPGLRVEDIEVKINGEIVSPTLTNSEESFECGSSCQHNYWEIQTDSISNYEATTTIVNDLNYSIACATNPANVTGDLTVVAFNEDHTVALIVNETYGYSPSGGGSWNNGFGNDNISVELHTGTNVGVNYCTDLLVDEEITEVFSPIDFSELPSDFFLDFEIEFYYGVEFPLCEECNAIASLHVENFWFQSSEGNFIKVELTSLSSDILLNYGG